MTIKAQTQQPNATPPADPGVSAEPANTEVPVATAPEEGEVVIQEVAPKPKVISVPTSAMKKIKEQAAAEGRTAYQRELDAQAAELGYKDHAAWVQATKEARAASTAKPSSTPETQQPEASTTAAAATGSTGNPEIDALRQENQRLSQKLESEIQDKKRINRQFARQKRQADRLANDLLAKEGETELKLAAKDAGVVDVDYAVTVFQRSIAGMSEDELKGVDEKKFFMEQLRKTHPHLYTPVQVPVNTGTKNGTEIQKASSTGPGPAPAPGNGQASNGTIDARSLSTEEFHKLLRKRGMSIPGTGGAVG